MVNPRVKTLWLDALRGEQYEQGHGCLRRGNRFCGIGVLCDIHGRETGTQWREIGDFAVHVYLNSFSVLPEAVRTWAEMDPAIALSIAEYDNEVAITFKELADRIEAISWMPEPIATRAARGGRA